VKSHSSYNELSGDGVLMRWRFPHCPRAIKGIGSSIFWRESSVIEKKKKKKKRKKKSNLREHWRERKNEIIYLLLLILNQLEKSHSLF